MPLGVRAYSMDLRERVVAAVDAGMTQRQAAERFGGSLRTVERYLARRRATGSLAATQQRHRPEPTVRRQLQAWLPDRLAAAADATLAEHVAAFVAAGARSVGGAGLVSGSLPPCGLSGPAAGRRWRWRRCRWTAPPCPPSAGPSGVRGGAGGGRGGV